MTPEFSAWGDAALAQLVQVTIVAIAVGMVARLAARQRPHLAYLLWMLVIVKCLTPPLAATRTSVLSWAWAERSAPAARESGPTAMSPIAPPELPAVNPAQAEPVFS